MEFKPCQGGNNCTEAGTHCQGCGRSHEEIAETRQIIEALTAFALKMDYENLEQFTQFVAQKAANKAMMSRMQAAALGRR